jgi:hypothetical protein
MLAASSASGEELVHVLDDLNIRVCDEFDHVTLTLRGRLTLRSVPQVREATVKWLLSSGRVLIDLSRLRATQTAMVTVFPTALDVAGGWPSARLVLFGADATLRSMLKSTRVPDTGPWPMTWPLPARCCTGHRHTYDATATYRCTMLLPQPPEDSSVRRALPGRCRRTPKNSPC